MMTIIATIFFIQAAWLIFIPYSRGMSHPTQAAICSVTHADLVCHDRFESDCQAQMNVRHRLSPQPIFSRLKNVFISLEDE
jgi:hypothetical protein